MPESEDFEPYRKIKGVAQKVSDFVSGIRAPREAKPGTRRTAEENARAMAESKSRATEIQNVKAYNRSIQNKPGAIKMIEPLPEKKFETRKPVRKLPARTSSR